MKQFRSAFNRIFITGLSLFVTAVAFAQDTTTSSTTTTTTSEQTPAAWYMQPWAWIVGGVILLLIIIVAARSGKSGDTDTVTVKRTVTTDVDRS